MANEHLPRYVALWSGTFVVVLLLSAMRHLNRWGLLAAVVGASAIVAVDAATSEEG